MSVVAADPRQLTSQEWCLLRCGVIMGRNMISGLFREAVPSSSLEFVEAADSDPAAIVFLALPIVN